MNVVLRLALLLALATLAACATGVGTQPDALERTLYDYSGAIRWNNFEVAYGMVDPKVREAEPLTDFELERLKQVQITRYDVVASSPLPDGRIAREIELGVVNRHTQAERTVRVRETWRYDEVSERWWQTEGLPDLSPAR
jgi:hypothetical protein